MEIPLPARASLAFVEALYADYARDPSSVPAAWRAYFEALPPDDPFRASPRLGPSFPVRSLFDPARGNGGGAAVTPHADESLLQERADQLVRAYRTSGHLVAAIDPLGLPRPEPAELSPEHHEISPADLDRPVSTRSVFGPERMPLRRLLERMRNTYCRSIGVQYMHIHDLAVRQWLQERMEARENRTSLAPEDQLRILQRLTDAVLFEEFVQKKYIGAKSFSLEGAESLIPLLELAFDRAGEQGVREVVIGMAHRGRLNVLANLMGKSPRAIFREFEDLPDTPDGPPSATARPRGDVKYHLGYSHDWVTRSGRNVHLSLSFNPSHLEFVNPVVLGRTRAKQDRAGDRGRAHGMALLIHGDAAFAGEGVVQEILNLSQVHGYRTGGTLHVVVNNQIGFTTPPTQARSSVYATDIATMLQSPIFHVNGEDPEAVAHVVDLAMEFRLVFERDVVIDMYCYRRRGHNEGDEPAFTQPVLYKAIRSRKPVREGYLDHLLQLGGITREQADDMALKRRDALEAELSAARGRDRIAGLPAGAGIWKGFRGGLDAETPEVDTGVPADRLRALLEALARTPEGFRAHPKIERFLEARRKMARGEEPLDWSAGEALALATLAAEGRRVRLTGQDTERGTFSHRHAVLHDHEDGRLWIPLQHLDPAQGPVEIRNSPLSEIAVLGFEYGYSLDFPEALVAWEAQFGDFWNVAQVIVDQFIASAEAKWQRLSGVVLLLPHGYEGQGPEHSSARMERLLMLAAEDNVQLAQPTTPAQYFHLLRRQVLRPLRKPLAVLTPKSLLRHARVVSPLEELATGRFRRFLPDARALERPRKILLCSGKVFYDLEEHRAKAGREDVAIVRIEQLYPGTDETLASALAPYPRETPVTWVQEEPENMGAWPFLRTRARLSGVCRPASSSPATGSMAVHRAEQRRLLEEAFA